MSVTGSARLRTVAWQIKQAGNADLAREMRQAINKPVAPFRAAVRSETSTLPSGYAPVLGGALRVNTSVKTKGVGASLHVVVYAKGRSEDRDVAAVNRGVLRHKTWGREPWHDQAVRPGFVDRPAKKLIDQIARQVADGLDRVAAKISGG